MSEGQVGNGIEINYKVYLNYVLKYWFLPLIGIVFSITYSYLQVRYTPPSYTTNARMLLKDEYSSWGQEYFLPGMELVSSRNRLVNELGVIKSFPLMERVAKEINWDISIFKIGNIMTRELYPISEFTVKRVEGKHAETIFLKFEDEHSFRIASDADSLESAGLLKVGDLIELNYNTFLINKVKPSISLDDPYIIKFNNVANWARYFQNTLEINIENDESSILILSHKEQTSEKSIDFLNQLMKTYINWRVEQNNLTASNTISFVDQQLQRIADSLVKTEYRLEKFQKKNFEARIFLGNSELDGAEKSNITEVIELEEALTNKIVQKEYYNALMKTVKQEEFTAFPSSAVFGFADPNIDLMIESLMLALKDLDRDGQSLKKESEYYEKSKKQVEFIKRNLYQAAFANVEQVNSLIDSLRSKINEQEGKVMQIPQEQREYFNLKREFKILSDLYTYLLNKRSEASIAKASNNPQAQILDFADPFRVKYTGPKPASIFLSSLIIGLFIPLMIILLIYIMNNKIVNSIDLELMTKIPVLGNIAYKKGLDSNLVIQGNLKSVVAEAYRSIRTNLNFMVEGKEKLTVLVTSSISGEGKTFTSINLAAIYAASGKKTILIGADLRKPKIFDDFGLNNKQGLSTYLINKGGLLDVIQPTKVENLDLISSGPIPPNPAELIDSELMNKLIKELKLKYDVIVIDSPPLGLVSDALLLKKYADAGLYIVRHNYTKKIHLRNINQLYEDKVISNVGIVVNAVRSNKGFSAYGYGNYGYGYGSYGYGYGYGYYDESKD